MMKSFNLIVYGLLVFAGLNLVHAQAKLMQWKLSANGSETVEILSSDNRIIRTLNADSLNTYRRLEFATLENRAGFKRFKITEGEKRDAVRSFFHGHQVSQSILDELDPTELATESSLEIQNEFVIYSQQIRMGGHYGIIGIKSKLTVYDKKGIEIGCLKETSDGYFSPAITADGRFVAVTYGGITTDESVTAVPFTGFRIFDLHSGEKIFEYPSTAQSDATAATSVGKYLITTVSSLPLGFSHYLVIDPSKRIFYRRKFNSPGNEGVIAITEEGFTMVDKTTLTYSRDFEKLKF